MAILGAALSSVAVTGLPWQPWIDFWPLKPGLFLSLQDRDLNSSHDFSKKMVTRISGIKRF